MSNSTKWIFYVTLTVLISLSNIFAQSTLIDDSLLGSTKGSKVGGSLTSSGYAPGKGNNHILYDVGKQVQNGYVEFEMKGFSHSNMPKDEDHAFLIIYDGRGISEPIKYSNDFKHNYFRWNIHWRQNRSAMKAVIACAAPTSSRLNSSRAVFTDKNGDGLDSHDRDWYTEPTGSGQSWNVNTWYKVKVQWNNKSFAVYVNGVKKWSASGPYDYNPVDLKIWLGSGPDKYDADVNVTYRNFKLVDLGGSSGPTNSLSVSPSSRSVSSSSGSTSFSVDSNVDWAVSDNASWLTVSPSSGSNDRTLTASYSSNSSSSSRTATITVQGSGITRQVTVTQAGNSTSSNSLTVSPSSRSVSSSSGSTTFSVTSNISWTTSDNASWLSVSPNSGSNNGTLTASYSSNSSSSSRTATITVQGSGITRTLSVTQSGVTSSGGGELTVSPTSQSVGESAGSFKLNIQTTGSWRVRDNTDWMRKTPKTGSGNGSSLIEFRANNTGAERTGVISITVGNTTKEVVVTQSGSGNGDGGGDDGGGDGSFAVSPSSQNVNKNAGSFKLSIQTSGSWRVRDNTDWMRKTPKSGTGNGTSLIEFKANNTGQERTGIVTVTVGNEEKEIVVTQSATNEAGDNTGGSFAVSPTSQTVGNNAGSFKLSIQTSGSWRVRDNTDWMRKTPKTGAGNGTSLIEFKANTTGQERTGIVSVTVGNEEKEIIVTQSANSNVTLAKSSSGSDIETTQGETDLEIIPVDYKLGQNYPNPFNPTTNITFSLPESGAVKLELFNVLGKKVSSIVNQELSAGNYNIAFDGSKLAAGTYFYRISTNNFIETKKMLLLK